MIDAMTSFRESGRYSIRGVIREGDRNSLYMAETVKGGKCLLAQLKSPHINPADIAIIGHEYNLLKKSRIPGVLSPVGLKVGSNSLSVIFEDFDGTPLVKQPMLREEGGASGIIPLLEIILRVARVLGELHEKEIVHGNIKPWSILVNGTGRVKLACFGFESAFTREFERIYDTAVIAEHLPYISPEQTGRMNRSVDYRSDFYSLGIVLYELLSGKPPFTSIDPLEIIHGHVAGTPPGINQNGALNAIVMKLLAKTAEERYQSAEGLAHDLSYCLRELKETGSVRAFTPGACDYSGTLRSGYPISCTVGKRNGPNFLRPLNGC